MAEINWVTGVIFTLLIASPHVPPLITGFWGPPCRVKDIEQKSEVAPRNLTAGSPETVGCRKSWRETAMNQPAKPEAKGSI